MGIAPVAMKDAARFKAKEIRQRLVARGQLPDHVVLYCYRPFDMRWLYWEPETKLLDEKRAEYFPHVDGTSPWLVAAQKLRRETARPQVIGHLGSLHLMERGANCFPAYLKGGETGSPLLDSADGNEVRPNLSERAEGYLSGVGDTHLNLFHHLVAILHAPTFEADNASALRHDWPRVPLPASREALSASADLGRQVAALLDSEAEVAGVTSGTLRPELKALGAIARIGGGRLSERDLRLEARWGYAGQGGVTMPGPGRTAERDYTGDERAAIGEGAGALGMAADAALALLGGGVRDVYINDGACWACVPERVWTYRIGGYQVIKKWLSYREHELLGRPLTTEEARHVTAMVRRIAALLLLEPSLDANYETVRDDAYEWDSG